MTKRISFDADKDVAAFLSEFDPMEKSVVINRAIRAVMLDQQTRRKIEEMERRSAMMKNRLQEVYGVTVEEA